MKVIKTEIEGVLVVEPRVFSDERGFFMETYKKSAYAAQGLAVDFVQDNHSRSTRGVLRGLHYQLHPYSMGKLVRALRGDIFDVGVDLRRGSPTFGKWIGLVLSESNKKMLYFPPGFAHGFLTMSDVAEVFYKCTGEYNQQSERGLLWNDPQVGIKWPLNGGEVLLSEKDKLHPGLSQAETNFNFEKGQV